MLPRLEEHESIVVVWFGLAGLVWAFLALWTALTWEIVPADPLRTILLLPVWLGFLAGSLLRGAGLLGDSLGGVLVLASASGLLVGLIVGSCFVLILRNRA